nr:MAG TPA: hypothetical protein [Caudoviricetes sp.]
MPNRYNLSKNARNAVRVKINGQIGRISGNRYNNY